METKTKNCRNRDDADRLIAMMLHTAETILAGRDVEALWLLTEVNNLFCRYYELEEFDNENEPSVHSDEGCRYERRKRAQTPFRSKGTTGNLPESFSRWKAPVSFGL